ncbi:MAG TPA: hypothetical protein VH165_19885 [Kofleriaceae bacterium]|nr:hypothetical protein [Kofleriaceae bacterium]
MAEPAREVAVLAASEAELVRLVRGLIARQPAEVAARVFRLVVLPPAISAACERVLGDTLAQLWPALWRRGGALPATSVVDGEPRRGRIWERHPPIGLTFSTASLQLLRRLTADPGPPVPPGRRARSPGDRAPRLERVARGAPIVPRPAPTVGDQVLIYLALEATAGTSAQAWLAAQWAVRASALAWLGFPDVLCTGGARELGDHSEAFETDEGLGALVQAVSGFDPLCQGAGAVVLEALTGDLARQWRTIELAKRTMTDPDPVIVLGAAQDFMLEAFMTACDRHGRRDLAGFVIDAAAPLFARGLSPGPIALDPEASLSDRAAARVAAGALLRGVVRWAAWDEAHRGVRFLDEDYAATQLVLARFERIGAAGAAQAAAWLSELAALTPATPA